MGRIGVGDADYLLYVCLLDLLLKLLLALGRSEPPRSHYVLKVCLLKIVCRGHIKFL